MGRFKAWHFIVFALALAALVFGATRFLGGDAKPDWAANLYAVDVVSGHIYAFNTKKHRAVFPAENPETGERTIIPASQTAADSDEWIIDQRYLDTLRVLGDKAKAVIDANEGRVKAIGDPIRVD